jgi:hypothetical protein
VPTIFFWFFLNGVLQIVMNGTMLVKEKSAFNLELCPCLKNETRTENLGETQTSTNKIRQVTVVYTLL